MLASKRGHRQPEPLKHGFQGYWSRRINDEHRLIYKVAADEVRVAGCRYHLRMTNRNLALIRRPALTDPQ
ncbi:Txe/YoeB family addiction module toxin [Flexivirga sp.]|uniref:Txe/YoeB family addiction module toxin n=1 Tax=Flexivirga sp. TaxID=1962927 RepID=UPI003F8040DF